MQHMRWNVMSIIFKTPKSENLTSAGVLILRIGLAFGFFWAGSGKVSDPALIGVAIMLVLNGSGKFGIDYLISKKFNRIKESEKQ